MMRPVRDAMVLSPPLVITYGEVDRLIEIARLALDLTQRDLYL
jgi:putrescine aminotransferase